MPRLEGISRPVLAACMLCAFSLSWELPLSAQAAKAAPKGLEARLPGKDMDEFMGDRGVVLRWDPIFSRYVFIRGSETFSVMEGAGYGIKDGTHVTGFGGESFSLRDPGSQAKAVALLKKEFPPPPEGTTLDIKTIFIDPGHGGKDVGAVGKFVIDGKTVSLNEKDVTLAAARNLAALLEKRYPDKKIVLSRSKDIYLPLDERTRIANKYASKTDSTVFISIHANASLDPKGSGYEVWYLPPEYRRQLIQEEDYVLLDKSMIPLINSLVEESYSVNSRILAQNVLKGMKQQIGDLSMNRGLKEEEWYVVRNARMPSILIEVGFVTNRQEFEYLRSNEYLNKLTQGIYNGVVEYIEDLRILPNSGG